MVKYSYDAWGNHTVTDNSGINLGNLNPFRYRSYYYDTETNLYFLKTRYYDPVMGRFVSQDDVSYLNPNTINGLNLYAYCGNNPVMRIDPNGTDWDWGKFWAVVGIVVIAAALIAVTIATAGAAAAGAAALASYLTFGTALFSVAASVATVGTYVLAGVAVAGIAAFAASDISAIYGGPDFMASALGSAYEPVKMAVHAIPAALGLLSDFAPISYYSDKADAKLQKVLDNPKSIQKYSAKEFQRIADRSSWNSGVTKNGYGHRAFDNYGNSIRNNFHGNREDHFNKNPYWVVSVGDANLPSYKYPYLDSLLKRLVKKIFGG